MDQNLVDKLVLAALKGDAAALQKDAERLRLSCFPPMIGQIVVERTYHDTLTVVLKDTEGKELFRATSPVSVQKGDSFVLPLGSSRVSA